MGMCGGAERRAEPLVTALMRCHGRAHRLVERMFGVERLPAVIGQHGKERQAGPLERFGKAVDPAGRDQIEKGRGRHRVDAGKQVLRNPL